MVFEKKKIQIETLSEYLVAMRTGSGLSLAEVSQKTSISIKFINALESGNFKNLPAGVYVAGFLKQLAKLYSVDADELICQYKKEQNIHKQMQAQVKFSGQAWPRKFFRKIVITPKLLSFLAGMLFILITVGYIVWQVWSINKTPALEIFEPANNSVIEGTTALVRGQTDPGNSVTVNDQGIFVDAGGNFKTQLGLSSGPKEIKVAAKNRFDKAVTRSINVNVAGAKVQNGDSVELKIDFTAPVALSVSLDGQANQNLTFAQGDSQTFIAKQKIIISTSDGGATKVTVNGQSLGQMGRAKERLENVPFTATSQTATGTNP